MIRGTASLLVAVVLGAALTGCGGRSTADTVKLDWRRVGLPMPPGPPGRIALRDAAVCDNAWYVVGAVIGSEGESRPAAWTSSDAQTWRTMPLDPHDSYAREAILYSVARHDGRVALLGARSGGAHGNPRTSSWYQRADGTMADMRAPFELYGGPEALSVSRIAGGPRGWIIAGTRTGGAAVWTSADATDFRLLDHDPALASDAENETTALDATSDGSGWVVVGRDEVTGRIPATPLTWTSEDGAHWRREAVPAGTDGFADLERVVRVGDGVVAAGIRDDRFGLWRRDADGWSAPTSFGPVIRPSGQPSFVSGLAAGDHDLFATVSDGVRLELWAERGAGWHQVKIPLRPPSTGDTRLTVAAAGESVLLLADDGRDGRVWISD